MSYVSRSSPETRLDDRLEKQEIGRFQFGKEPPLCIVGAFMFDADERDLVVRALRSLAQTGELDEL
jgi:hypothetical protein